MANILGGDALEIVPGEVVEVLLAEQHPTPRVVDVQEGLQVLKHIRPPHLFDGSERQGHAVPRRQREHALGLERAFDVQVELRFGETLKECVHPEGGPRYPTTSRKTRRKFNPRSFRSSPSLKPRRARCTVRLGQSPKVSY